MLLPDYLVILLISIIPSGLLLILYLTQRQEHQRLVEVITKLQQPNLLDPNSPAMKSADVMHDAHLKATQVLTAAELDAIKVEASADLGAKLMRNQLASFESQYEDKLKDHMELVQKDMLSYLQKSELYYRKLLETLVNQSQQATQRLEQGSQTKINEVLLKFEQNLTSFLEQSQQKSLEAISLEIKSTRQLIETYKQQQLQIVDENIVAVLERTLALVLRNKLSLKDQMDLVYEALEKAKVEKFFA